MTNEELLTDLKQFIATTVSQEVAGLRTELKEDIKSLRQDLQALDKKVDSIQNAIADALTHTNEATGTTLQDHERRLRRLERRTA